MGTRIAVPFAVLVLFAGCGSNGGPEVSAAPDSVPAAAAAGTLRGGGPMAGMGARAMREEWRRHMASMRGVGLDSLRAMMPRHRQMVTRMMEMVEAAPGGGMRMGHGMGPGMGLGRDSAWIATRDSLHRDLDRIGEMSPEELEAFLEAHDARMQRMLELRERMEQPEAQ